MPLPVGGFTYSKPCREAKYMKFDFSRQTNIKALKQMYPLAVAGFFLGLYRILSRDYPTLYYLLIYFSFASVIGFLVSGWLSRKGYLAGKLAKVVYLANLVSWLSPIFGFFTASMTLGILSNQPKGQRKIPFFLAALAVVLSLLNLGVFFILKAEI